ncbi:hook-length control protein FliK [Lachnospiraceae bacterium XBB1006]|nr:hook-length control protein FliK [Lachnospiraceae bacterium XBB1006]
MTDSKIQFFTSLIGNVNKTDIATSASEAVGAALPEFGRVLTSAGTSYRNRKENGEEAVAFPQFAKHGVERNVGLRNQTTTTTSHAAKAKFNQKLENAKNKAEALPSNIDEVMASVNAAISNTICEELNIQPEDLENALMHLGLNMTDLLEPSNVAKLFVYFKPEMSVTDVLTDADFMNLMDAIRENTQVILEEFGMERTGFDDLLRNVAEKQPELLFPLKELATEKQTSVTMEEPVEMLFQTEEGTVVKEVNQPEQEQIDVANADQKVTMAQTEQMVDEETIETPMVQVATEKTVQPQQNAEELTEVASEPEVMAEEKVQVVNVMEEQSTDSEGEPSTEDDRLAKLFEKKPEKESGLEHKPMEHPQTETIRVNTQTITTPEGTTVTEQSVRVVDLQNLVTEVTNYIRMQSTGTELSSIEMQLTPANLGKVLVEVVSNQGEITARIATQTEAAKEAMEANLVQLKDNLESQGIKVNAVEVTVETHSFEQNLQEDGSKEQQQLQREMQKQNRRMNLNLNEMTLDDLEGLMSEEDMVVAKIMKDNGNTLNIGV